MKKIKETKSVRMYYHEETKCIELALKSISYYKDAVGFESSSIEIPMNKVFQVKRGLESAVQRYYRKHDKNKTQRG